MLGCDDAQVALPISAACQHAVWDCLTESGKQSRVYHPTGAELLTC